MDVFVSTPKVWHMSIYFADDVRSCLVEVSVELKCGYYVGWLFKLRFFGAVGFINILFPDFIVLNIITILKYIQRKKFPLIAHMIFSLFKN